MSDLFHVLKAKIHRAVVTQAELDYVGSITIDQNLLDASGMYAYERVLISNMSNGNRLETYIISGERGSGVICLNGPCAHFFTPGDEVIIMAFKMTDEAGAKSAQPIVIFPSDNNCSYSKQHGV
jgi:aspartate 1-decarboxylase